MENEATLMEKALVLAVEAHAGQKDKVGDPYILHVLRVFMRAQECSVDEDVHIAALLHDVVEDTPVSLARIRDMFGEQIGQSVDAITKRKGESLETYMSRVTRDPAASRVKAIDAQDNYSRLRNIEDRAVRERLENKYRKTFGLLGCASD